MTPSNHGSNRDPTPCRQIERRIKPAFLLEECPTLQVLAAKLQKRIRQTLHGRGAGTMVAINGSGEVFLLMAGEARTEKFFAENYGIVMGIYAELPMGGGEAMVPDVDVLAEDIRFHLPAGAIVDAPIELSIQLELEFPPLNLLPIAA
ncbi:hypothetical protein ATCM_03810 [Stenotrophomonas sp. ATCM1_4]|uniref:hypothetical protein n=1 Tax=Stenotrophomonas sp. ATCM1_4 TaxID=2259330 RepID=UPI0010539E08|nr:hypothetical protein [Stenotrophomonas sp. ATCM1_4]TDB26842.1 hypothetical protein ATCM_03810 [Stenotrophomonas sp. ATCM1_4]